jgi:two-component system, chemotaxis family, response regulator PixH
MSTVLLVEDSLTETEVITRYLRQAGLTVVHVGSVEAAQERLSTERPDLIVSDVILPGQSGFEFCRDLKADPNLKTIPFILCSTKNTSVDKMWGDMLGADAYVTKPVNQQELIETAQKLLHG